MISTRKRTYMKHYNQLPSVKARKAGYMRKIRAQEDQEAARRLVGFLLEQGYEDMAYAYALERAPEMLITIRARSVSGITANENHRVS